MERRESWNGLSSDSERSVGRYMGIPLLNYYRVPPKRTRVELFSFLILRACFD